MWDMIIEEKLKIVKEMISIYSLSLLATGSVFFTHRVNTLVRSVLLRRNNATTTMLRLLFLYQFWLAEIFKCHKPRPTRDETCDLQIASPRTLMLPGFFFYTSGTPHARHVRAHFELRGRPFCSSLLVSFFLPFGVAMKGIHSTQLRCHITFLSFVRLSACFLSS